MPAKRSSFIPLLAVLGSVTFLGTGTAWASQALFPLVGAQGTTALRVGFSALLLLLLLLARRPWRHPVGRAGAPSAPRR
jgi:inner membrane transporter RhtA